MWRWGALAVVVAVLWAATPPVLPVCGFRWLTGHPCPLCGLTRAMFALAKGHVGEAVRWHALSPLAAGMMVGVVWNPARVARFWLPCLVMFGIYGVWRMVG